MDNSVGKYRVMAACAPHTRPGNLLSAKEIDNFEDSEEAECMANEYAFAYGPGWKIWVEERE